MKKLWQETRDPGCKTAVNWVSKAIRRMARKKALERWETVLANTKVTPQAIWPIAKSLANRDGPRAPTTIHGPLGLKFHPQDKANVIADCLENQPHPMTCVTKTMNGGWKLESKLCSKLKATTPLKE
jgi:hypothetical protein